MFVTPCVVLLLCTFCFGVDSRAVNKKNNDIQHTSQVARDEGGIVFREEAEPTGVKKVELPEQPEGFGNRFGVRVGKCPEGYVMRASRCRPA